MAFRVDWYSTGGSPLPDSKLNVLDIHGNVYSESGSITVGIINKIRSANPTQGLDSEGNPVDTRFMAVGDIEQRLNVNHGNGFVVISNNGESITYNYTGSAVKLTIPLDGAYTIECYGAQGGGMIKTKQTDVEYTVPAWTRGILFVYSDDTSEDSLEKITADPGVKLDCKVFITKLLAYRGVVKQHYRDWETDRKSVV